MGRFVVGCETQSDLHGRRYRFDADNRDDGAWVCTTGKHEVLAGGATLFVVVKGEIFGKI